MPKVKDNTTIQPEYKSVADIVNLRDYGFTQEVVQSDEEDMRFIYHTLDIEDTSVEIHIGETRSNKDNRLLSKPNYEIAVEGVHQEMLGINSFRHITDIYMLITGHMLVKTSK